MMASEHGEGGKRSVNGTHHMDAMHNQVVYGVYASECLHAERGCTTRTLVFSNDHCRENKFRCCPRPMRT